MQKKNILFFTCFNSRSIQLESIIIFFKKRGHKVILLTICPKGNLHYSLEKKNISTHEIVINKSPKVLYYLKLILFLIKFSKSNNIHFIHSHLQIPNLISSISRFFMKSHVLNVRHNSDVIQLNGSRKEKIVEKIINILSKNIIAISNKVNYQLAEVEKVNPKKIYQINNGYDFIEYEKLSLDSNNYLRIREKYNSRFLITSPARLIKTKRHHLTIKAIMKLKLKGLDIKLLILGDGPEKDNLINLINKYKLSEFVHLISYKENIADYLKASDVVTLLTESEASNNVIKEAGYFKKTVIVCNEVGDFNDYIENGVNGYLISKYNPVDELIHLIENLYFKINLNPPIGENLKSTVLKKFNVESIGEKYLELHNKIEK